MEDYWRFDNDTGSGLVVGVPTGERLGESEGERAEAESLRAELLNDPHTLLLLPGTRERLYKMSFIDRDDWGFRPLFDLVEFMGGNEKFYRLCKVFLHIGKSNPKFARSKSFHRSYSSGSLDFRDVYVSVVLFHGAYVWIKFRQAAASNTSLKRKSYETPGVYRRAVKDKSGAITHYRYEPRFKPPREKLDSGTTVQFNCLSLGQYDSEGEAKIVFQIAAFYYGKGEGVVALEDGSFLTIPAMDEQEKRLSGMDKAKWVTGKAKQVFEGLQQGTVMSRRQRRMSNAHCDPSQRFRGAFPGLSASGDVEGSETPHVELASGGAEQVADGGGSSHESIRAAECPGVQHNVPELENGAEEPDDHDHDDEGTIPGSDIQQTIAERFFGSANVWSEQFSLLGSEIFEDLSPPLSDPCATPGFVGIPNLNRTHGWEMVGAVHDTTVKSVQERDLLQQVVSRQKKLLQDYAVRTADLQHQLLEADVMISELRQVIEQLRAGESQEGAAAKPAVATVWSAGIFVDFQQEEGRQFLGP